MPKGQYPTDYFNQPAIDKPVDEIYALMDAFSYEIFEDDQESYKDVEFFVVMPPLQLEGRFLKGIFFSHGPDVILSQIPQLQELFHSISDSMWCSYPSSRHADAYFTHYDNPERTAWYCQTHPESAQKIFIPRDNADFVNEAIFKPDPTLTRDIDLLCVARLETAKNLPFLAESLKVYRQKYPQRPIRLTMVTGHTWDLNHQSLNYWERKILREVEAILVHPHEYIHFVSGYLNYEQQLPQYFARSRAYISTSLLGWKNQRMHEAMCSNTPVISLKDFNRYARGNSPILDEGAGLCSDYDPEAMAETIHQVLENPDAFHPRNRYLKTSGRKNFFNACVDAFPYYSESLPDYTPGRHSDSYWLDQAMQENYQRSLHDFNTMKDLWAFPFRAQGVDRIRSLVENLSDKLHRN